MKCVVRIYETETEAPNYAAAVAKKIPQIYNISDMTEFPPLPKPEFEFNNVNTTFRVIDGGRRCVYHWSDLLNNYNNNSKNVVMWKLLNGDEQHGKVCDIYNKVYMCAMEKFPMFFGFSINLKPLKPTQQLVKQKLDDMPKPTGTFSEDGKQLFDKPPRRALNQMKEKAAVAHALKPNHTNMKVLNANAPHWTPNKI
jgi:hypothetical protein